MLILSRRVGEKINIGDDMSVTVMGINGKQIKIGIEAPKNVSVHREEVYAKIKSEQQTDNSENN